MYIVHYIAHAWFMIINEVSMMKLPDPSSKYVHGIKVRYEYSAHVLASFSMLKIKSV